MVTDGLSINISANTGSAAQNIINTANALTSLDDKAKSANTDMSGLVHDMTAAAANMVSISQNISVSAAGLGSFQSNIDAVDSALQGITTRFDTLSSSMQASYSAFDSAAASVSSLSNASEASAAGLGSVVDATDGFTNKMSDLKAATTGTTDGMSDLQRELRDTLTTLRGFSENITEAGQDAKAAADKIGELSLKVNSIPSGGNVLGLAAGFKSLKGVIATLGIGKFIKDSNDAYNVQMQNELKLTSHMKRRMNATDDEVRSVKELASAQQRLGVIGDEIQLAGAQQLTTYARESSTLKTLLPAMNDLIAQNAGYKASVGDATNAADMLGHALTGQYTSLKRMGVVFTEAQEQVLKYGTESQKAAVLADAINSKVGNMNELLANTPTGQLKQLQNDFGDLQEEIGATFQPLISAIVPVASVALKELTPPILAVSRGIGIIGEAITELDSPAVRAIALTAAAVAVVNKLKFALGGTAAGIILAGTALTWLLGSSQEAQNDIGAVVSNAYNSATDATNEATDAASDYNEELGNVEKTAKRLAGFDTITKLSGGGSGALVKSLLGDNGLDILKQGADVADSLGNELDALSAADVRINLDEAWNTVKAFGDDVYKLMFGTEDEQYAALNSLNDKVKKIYGEPFTQFWQGVGNNIYDIVNGDDSKIYKGWLGLDGKLRTLFGKFYSEGVSPYFQKMGSGIESIVSAVEKAINGDYSGAINELTQAGIKGAQLNPFLSDEQREQLANAEIYVAKGEYDRAAPSLDQNIYKPAQQTVRIADDIGKEIGKTLLLGSGDLLGTGVSAQDAVDWWSTTWQKFGNWVFNSQMQTYAAIASQPVSQPRETRYTDIPLRPSGMPSNVPKDQISTNVTVYINDEKRDPTSIETTDGRYGD